MSLSAKNSMESPRRKFFMNTTCIMSESRNQTFLGSGGQNESKCQKPPPIGNKKRFHELDVHHVYKVGIKRFWAQEAKMSLSAKSSLQSARRKFFMNSTYIMSRK